MVALVAMIWLSGCGQAVSKTELDVYCPAPTPYSEHFNSQLADEVEALPQTSTAIPEVIGDYARLRDRLEYCRTVSSETFPDKG